jgi:hypothetical protein
MELRGLGRLNAAELTIFKIADEILTSSAMACEMIEKLGSSFFASSETVSSTFGRTGILTPFKISCSWGSISINTELSLFFQMTRMINQKFFSRH